MDKSEIIDLIEEFCIKEGYDYYEDYSGRGMFGKKCAGIVSASTSMEVLIKLIDFLIDAGVEYIESSIGIPSWDSLGLDSILYFPSLARY